MEKHIIKDKTYDLTLDLLRIIAIFSVVGIHLIHIIYGRNDFVGGKIWWIANISNSFFRNSVPVFIILSGYLNLGRNIQSNQLSKKINQTILIPLFAWIIIYLLWDKYWLFKTFSLKSVISHFLVNDIWHLYFLPILLGLYLAIPCMDALIKNSPKLWYRYVLLFNLIGLISIYTQCFIYPGSHTPTIFTSWLPYLGYFNLGYLIKINKDKIVNLKYLWLFIFILSLVSISWLNFNVFNLKLNQFWQGSVIYYENYLSITVFLLSISWFNLLLSYGQQLSKFLCKFQKFIRLLSSLSFGIYLSHLVVMDLVDYFFNFQIISENSSFNVPLWYYISIRPFLVCIFSVAIVFIISKIKILKKIIGQ